MTHPPTTVAPYTEAKVLRLNRPTIRTTPHLTTHLPARLSTRSIERLALMVVPFLRPGVPKTMPARQVSNHPLAPGKKIYRTPYFALLLTPYTAPGNVEPDMSTEETNR